MLVPVILAGVLAILFGWRAFLPDGYSGPAETLTIGYSPTEAAGLVYIAEDRGFFAANGVNIVHKHFSTGVEAMDALLRKEIDIGGASEVPFITKVFAREQISVYVAVDKLQYVFLLGRKDRGIEAAADLKGKRIGVPRGTIAEFYLGRFLALNGLRMQDITLVATAPAGSADAITSGEVDGVVIWNPFAYQIGQQMGNRVTLLRVQSHQPAFALAAARNDWFAGHKAVLVRSIKAVLQAEQYVTNHPAEARAIVQKRMKYSDDYMAAVWNENQYSLSLQQSLITAMEDQARWMIDSGLTKEKQVPDFFKYIYFEALEEVKPGAVKIVR